MTDTSSASCREAMLARLRQDLIGPYREDERLTSRPSDVWLTGILWPRNTALAPEEDETLSVAPTGTEADDDGGAQAQPATAPMRRPSTAGVSFAAGASSEVATVIVGVRFALYDPVEEDDGGIVWVRRPMQCTRRIDLSAGVQDLPLSETGVSGLRLNVRVAAFSAGLLATVTLVNGAAAREPGRNAIEALTLFQTELEIRGIDGTRLIARPSRRAVVDEDDASGALLYRGAREFASGHTCSAAWTPAEDDPEAAERILTTWIPSAVTPAVSADGHACFSALRDTPDSCLSASWLASARPDPMLASLDAFCAAYGQWIDARTEEAARLPADLNVTAQRHLAECRTVEHRMAAGVDRLRRDPLVLRSFQLANEAMLLQRRWGGAETLRWRPFQLGFVLLALESTLDGGHPDRDVMDLLWFPTGGGKTEAYLALIALTAFHRRLSRPVPDDGAGVAAIMRYTLRLLTSQQFQRAAAMICACEAIRRAGSHDDLGSEPFSIGLWVGDGATPNYRVDAFASWREPNHPSPRQLGHCPCCRQPLDYRQATETSPVEVWCQSTGCALSSARLPVWTVDEDVYEMRPTLLIGTVDKFAQIVRRSETSRLFAVGSGAQPQLILQDELHLIAGPLGTLAGLYETALDLILSADGSRPKIIGSTATIRRAAEQVRALFDRDICQFPPPGLDAADSGFAVVDTRAAGRLYAAVTTAGRSAKFTLQAVSASLLQASEGGLPAEARDPWSTLVAYFNSLRELGGALVLMQDDVNDTLRLTAKARGEPVRRPASVEELTSRRSQAEIVDMLDRLGRPLGAAGALDVVLATNMLSVGVDVPRLGLMLVNGQPKTMAEYIQATSRVGRGAVAGLVVSVLNNAKPRDRSHYETFRTWHDALYRNVEATSVTPFASRARDRALHAVLVAVVRHLAPGMRDTPALTPEAEDAAITLIDRIAVRAAAIDPLETEVREELLDRLRRWRRRAPTHYWRHNDPAASLMQSAEDAAARRAAGRTPGSAWPTPNTLRGVEPATPYRITERLPRNDHAS
ncbi:MAG: helicase-related protein [Brevundimonas sp.]